MTEKKMDDLQIVLGVLRDGQRRDRYLRRAEDGHLYTSPDKTFLGDDGPDTPAYVEIPVVYDATEDEEEEFAWTLIDLLDEINEE